MKNAIFIVGGPGSGKDILIRYISDSMSIQEYTTEQIMKFTSFSGNLLIKGNAYDLDSIIKSKNKLEENFYNSSVIFVDVSDYTSRKRLCNRVISEQSRYNKFKTSKENLSSLHRRFESFYLFNNDLELDENLIDISEIDLFLESVLNPISSIKKRSLRNAKNYVYSNFMKDKETSKGNKPKSFYSDGPISPSGLNQYDIRMAGQSSVINYNNEDIGSPENLSSLTGMSINPPDDMPKLDKFTIEPEIKKPKLYKKFNSPAKEEIKNAKIWKKTKEIVFGEEEKEEISDKFKRYLK